MKYYGSNEFGWFNLCVVSNMWVANNSILTSNANGYENFGNFLTLKSMLHYATICGGEPYHLELICLSSEIMFPCKKQHQLPWMWL
jgi:hypothetical protein